MTKNILKIDNSITIDNIQQLALFIHRKTAIHIKREVTKVYLLSVIGKLKESDCDLMEIDRRFWPIQVQTLMLNYRKSLSRSNTTSTTTAAAAATTARITASTVATGKISVEEQINCQNMLQEQLREMKDKIEFYISTIIRREKEFFNWIHVNDGRIY